MKFNFKNLAKLFLAGACFAAVGCTDYAEDIHNLNDRIDALETETIAPLKADLAKVQEALVAAQAAIEAQKAKHTEDINALNEQIDALDKEIDTKVSKSEFDAVKADLEAKLALCATKAELEAEVKALNDKDAELQGLIDALDARLKANEDLAAKNAEDIKKNRELFDEFKKATNETLDLLKAADAALESRIVDLEKFQDSVTKQLEEHFAAFDAYTAKTDKAIADLQADLDAQKIRISANETAIGIIKMQITNIQAELESLYNEMVAKEEALKKADEQLQANINSLDAKVEGYKKATDEAIAALQAKDLEQDGRILANEIAIGILKSQVLDLQSTIDALDADLRQLIANLDEKLSGQLDALKERLQSIVFVPEYTDGMATIEYAKFDNGAGVVTVIETVSKFKYQVHPAECAAAIEAADLTFLFQELKTRNSDAALNVTGVEVVDAAKGIIEVTAMADNLYSLYDGAKNWAVSLVFTKVDAENDVTNSIASAYTTLIADADANADVITVGFNSGSYKTEAFVEYIDQSEFALLEGIEPIFTVVTTDGTQEFQGWANDTFLATYDLQIECVERAPVGTPATYISALDSKEYPSTDIFAITLADNKFTFKNQLPTPDKATVGCVVEVDLGAKVSSNGAVVGDVYETAKVTVTKIQGIMTLSEQTINWERALDNEADGITPVASPKRELKPTASSLTRKNAEGTEEDLTDVAGTTYENIIAGTLTSLQVNGNAIAAPLNVTFAGTNDQPTLTIEGFEWDKTYEIVAVYDLANITVTLNANVTTAQAKSEINLEKQTITWNFAQDWTSELADTDAAYKPTFRAVPAVADNAELYAKLFTDGNLVSVTENFVLGAAKVEATKFAWNSEVVYSAVYAMPNEIVTVNGSIATAKAAFEKLSIALTEENWLLTPSFLDNSATAAEALPALFEGKLNNLGEITIADYLTNIFATYKANATESNLANTVAYDNTKLVIAADGQSINSIYCMNDIATTEAGVAYVYNFKTWYGQEIEFTKTLNLGVKPAEAIELPAETVTLVKDLIINYEDAVAAAIFEKVGNVDKNLFTAESYAKAIVVNTPKAEVNTANNETRPGTRIKLVNNGATANTGYDYRDFNVTPESVVYNFVLTTWYGQEITINKTVNIELPKYNYRHEGTWVAKEGDNYYSQVVPTYKPELPTSSLLSYSVNAVNLNRAFSVVDANNAVVADLSAVGLKSVFSFRQTPGAGITMTDNMIQYNDADDFVAVLGTLSLVNSNGVETVLPTTFDEGNVYASYTVKKYDPIGELVTKDYVPEILGGTETFTCNCIEQLTLADNRGGNYQSYNVLENGAWVIGNDANGFASGVSAKDIYGFEDVVFTCSDIPVNHSEYLKFENNQVIFNYTSELRLENPIELVITAKVKYTWGEREKSFKCIFQLK